MLVEVASVSIYELEKARIGPADVERALADFAGPGRWDIRNRAGRVDLLIDWDAIPVTGHLAPILRLESRRTGARLDIRVTPLLAGIPDEDYYHTRSIERRETAASKQSNTPTPRQTLLLL